MPETPDPSAPGDRTVHRRRKGEAPTQDFLPIAEVKHDTVVLKNGGLRAVLSVSSMNFSLKSEEEQQAIITSYQQFINMLSFPIQIVVRSRKINIDAYVANLRGRSETQKNPLIKAQTIDYADFIDRLIDVSDIMQKRFYAVVPVEPSSRKIQMSFLQKYFGFLTGKQDSRGLVATRERQFKELSAQLLDRVNVIQGGLAAVGLSSQRLTTSELIALFYETYNPETSSKQKLPPMKDLNVKEYVL